MRRGAIFQLTLLALVIGGITTAVAVIPHWLPPTASEQADRIDFVFWYVTAICIVIYAIVIAVLLFSAWKFRAAPDDDADGPPIHGHTGLEIAWTAIPFALVTSMAIISAVVLARNDATGSDPLRVDVTAQQFAWTFKYPQQHGLTTNILRLPIHRPTKFSLQALDVIHSFWVPEFGQKQDAVPGITTNLDGDSEQDRHLPDHLHRALRPRPRGDALDGRRHVAAGLRQVGEGRRQGRGRRRRRGRREDRLREQRLQRVPHA